MREIKFRMWQHNEMYYSGLQNIDNPEPFCHHPVMQCTGVKDKNNKEIYEGDIVKNYSINSFGEVFYNALYGRFMIRDEKRAAENCDNSFQFGDEVEIMGNIYI